MFNLVMKTGVLTAFFVTVGKMFKTYIETVKGGSIKYKLEGREIEYNKLSKSDAKILLDAFVNSSTSRGQPIVSIICFGEREDLCGCSLLENARQEALGIELERLLAQHTKDR
jgi:hypothetical protein